MCPDPDTRPPAEKPHVGFLNSEISKRSRMHARPTGARPTAAHCAPFTLRGEVPRGTQTSPAPMRPRSGHPDREKPHVGFLNSQIS